SRSGIRYYEGINGVKSILAQMLEVESGGTLYGLTDEKYAGFIDNELRNWMDTFVETRRERGIYWRGIVNKSPESDKTLRSDPSMLRAIKQIENVSLIAAFHIFGDNVAITITKDKPMGVVIENRDIAETARTLFNAYWELLPEYE
ncbi:MAG: hypothetical protein KDD62_05775, partial [Bdellovibrionales bacterium]|nr:hypothetical protein [Bdellovibrionales bacterium]